MRSGVYIIVTALLVLLFTGCKEDTSSSPWGEDDGIAVAFSISSNIHSSRTSSAVVQANGSFRGIQDLLLIPFAKQGKIESTDSPKLFGLNEITEYNIPKVSSHIYYYDDCVLMPGVASFLVYAKGRKNFEDKSLYGSLAADFPADGNPAGITISPEKIWSSDEPPTEGDAIAAYLTTIANAGCQYNARTYYWRTATDSRLQALYLNFINRDNQNTEPLSSSTASVKSYVMVLKEQIEALSFDDGTVEALLQTAIVEAINNGYNTIPADYPASVGLPDGAAIVRWIGSQFVTQTTTTTISHIPNIHRYAYPAELYYYANSRIKTTITDKRLDYYDAESSWDGVLSHYETDNGVVYGSTKSVAIKDPVQYAVACLQVSLQPASLQPLRDAAGNAVSVTATSFPLTGLIIGNQRPVGFDFKPTTTSEVDVHYAYDRYPVAGNDDHTIYLPPLGGETTENTNTLLLETPDGEEVTFIAEFKNNSGTTFRGINGMVYPGTCFYLVGTISPKENPSADYERRALTQDFTTTVRASVNSLSKAYNVLPDILSPRLEIGIQLTTSWTMATPTDVELE